MKSILWLLLGSVLLSCCRPDDIDPMTGHTILSDYQHNQCLLYAHDPHAFAGQKPSFCP